MIELVWDKTFICIAQKWQKKHPELNQRFKERLKLFSQQPFHPSLRTHSLSGNLEGLFAFSITYEYRLVFKFISEDIAVSNNKDMLNNIKSLKNQSLKVSNHISAS